jgi:hypothetical protein
MTWYGQPGSAGIADVQVPTCSNSASAGSGPVNPVRSVKVVWARTTPGLNSRLLDCPVSGWSYNFAAEP